MPRRVLVLDDAESVLFAFARHFACRGFRVDCARELEEAEALVIHTSYDLVIADLSLSGADGREGLEILRFLRRHRPSLPVVVLTANATPAAAEEALACGADAFVSKSRSLAEIAEIAERLSGRAS